MLFHASGVLFACECSSFCEVSRRTCLLMPAGAALCHWYTWAEKIGSTGKSLEARKKPHPNPKHSNVKFVSSFNSVIAKPVSLF